MPLVDWENLLFSFKLARWTLMISWFRTFGLIMFLRPQPCINIYTVGNKYLSRQSAWSCIRVWRWKNEICKQIVYFKFCAIYFPIDVPQTPIHIKPQLARSASKTRGLRAPEVGETKKVDIQSGVIDFLDMTPSRPPQLAPVTKVRYGSSVNSASCL